MVFMCAFLCVRGLVACFVVEFLLPFFGSKTVLSPVWNTLLKTLGFSHSLPASALRFFSFFLFSVYVLLLRSRAPLFFFLLFVVLYSCTVSTDIFYVFFGAATTSTQGNTVQQVVEPCCSLCTQRRNCFFGAFRDAEVLLPLYTRHCTRTSTAISEITQSEEKPYRVLPSLSE